MVAKRVGFWRWRWFLKVDLARRRRRTMVWIVKAQFDLGVDFDQQA
jgi:hypothetical protein